MNLEVLSPQDKETNTLAKIPPSMEDAIQKKTDAEEGSLVTALTDQANLGEKEEGDSGQRNSTDKRSENTS